MDNPKVIFEVFNGEMLISAGGSYKAERSMSAPQKDAVPWLIESRNVNASKRDAAFELGDFVSSNIYDERATMCFVAATELESLRVRVRLMEQLLATRIIEMRFAERDARASPPGAAGEKDG